MLGVAAALSVMMLMAPGAPDSNPVGGGPSRPASAAEAGHPLAPATDTLFFAVHLALGTGVRAPAAIDPKGCVPRWRCG